MCLSAVLWNLCRAGASSLLCINSMNWSWIWFIWKIFCCLKLLHNFWVYERQKIKGNELNLLKCWLLICVADREKGSRFATSAMHLTGGTSGAGSDFIPYTQKSSLNISGTSVPFSDVSRSPLHLISPWLIILSKTTLCFPLIFPLQGCLPPLLALAEMLEMKRGKKYPQPVKFAFLKVFISILGSKLIEQNRI